MQLSKQSHLRQETGREAVLTYLGTFDCWGFVSCSTAYAVESHNLNFSPSDLKIIFHRRAAFCTIYLVTIVAVEINGSSLLST